LDEDRELAFAENYTYGYKQADIAFQKELQEFANFFSTLQYGPYEACFGVMGDDEFICAKRQLGDWNPSFEEPSRGSSKLVIHTERFMAGFNMFAMNQLESALGMVLIIVVVFVMGFAGLALSNVVNDLAVKPMERMLGTVRNIAKTVFKFTAEQAEEEENDDGDLDEVEEATEMVLLEKVVNKLATLAEISTKKQPDFDKDNMGAEDLGVLNMMGGQETQDTTGDTLRKSHLKRQTTVVMKVEEVGVSMDTWQSWMFNPLNLTKDQQKALTAWAVFNHQGCSTFVRDLIPDAKMQNFVNATESGYLANPYHNYAHAVDVCHTTARLQKVSHAELFLSEIEQFSVLVAAIGHDLGHPGVNNPFLIEASHELALRYNDKSPLENMHCAKLFMLCSAIDSNIFANLAKEQFREVRKHCIEMILHTDMVVHFAMVKNLTMLYQMNSDMFDNAELSDLDTMQDPQESELLRQGDNKKLVMNLLLHSADVSNPCKNWNVCELWAYLVLDEFFAQGDQEKMMGLPVQMLNDRDKVNRPNSQIGFIEFVVAPLIAAQVRLFPNLFELGDNLGHNLEKWENVWINESKPNEEEKGKVRTRVDRVQKNMEDAKHRGRPPQAQTNNAPPGQPGRKQAFN
jgi:cAMP-specific phosphodiesterase 4